jgi:hypothetical protein
MAGNDGRRRFFWPDDKFCFAYYTFETPRLGDLFIGKDVVREKLSAPGKRWIRISGQPVARN